MKKQKYFTLFVVEEGEACSFLLKYKLLKSPEFRILHYRNSAGVLENLLFEQPDLIILDDALPVSDSIDLFTTLEKHFRKIPVIILSEPFHTPPFPEFIGKGSYEYISKDRDSAKLVDKLIETIVKTMRKKEKRTMNMQQIRIQLAIAVLVLSIAAIFWLMY